MKDKFKKNPYVPLAYRNCDSTANNIYCSTPVHHDEFLKLYTQDAPKVTLYLPFPVRKEAKLPLQFSASCQAIKQSQRTFKMREDKKFSDFITTDMNWYRRCHIKSTLSVGLKRDAYTEPRQDTLYCPRTASVHLWCKSHCVL